MRQWYALHTKLRAEKRVVEALQIHGIEAFIPLIRINSDDRHYVEVALFPGYLFMRADLEQEKEAYWKWLPGVRHVVSYGDEPAALPDTIINVIKREPAQREAISPAARKAYPDRSVNVNGSLEDLLLKIRTLVAVEQELPVFLAYLDSISGIRIDPASLKAASPDRRQKRPRRSRGRGRIIRPQGS